MNIKKTCQICGNEFIAQRSDALVCSNVCRKERNAIIARFRHKAKNYEPKKCIVCGKNFKPKMKTQVTCGGECSKINNRKVSLANFNAHKKKPKVFKKCCICNKGFLPRNNRQITCGDKECQRMRLHEVQRTEYTKIKKEPAAKPKKGKSITELAVEAREKGYSYGDYVAMVEKGAVCQKIARRA